MVKILVWFRALAVNQMYNAKFDFSVPSPPEIPPIWGGISGGRTEPARDRWVPPWGAHAIALFTLLPRRLAWAREGAPGKGA